MAHLYYDEHLPAQLAVGDTVTVRGEEARHAVTVARLKSAERVLVGDGAGTLAKISVTRTEPGRAAEFAGKVLKITHSPTQQPELVVAQALAKGDYAERAVQLCTELGVDRVLPWQAARSVALWQAAQKQQKGRDKWRRIAREAAKQSLRSRIPQIDEQATTAGLTQLAAAEGTLVVVLDPWQAGPISQVLAAHAKDAARIVFVIGPEGGITEQEIAELTAAGAVTAVLGSNVLRTSTAGAAALAAYNTFSGRW